VRIIQVCVRWFASALHIVKVNKKGSTCSVVLRLHGIDETTVLLFLSYSEAIQFYCRFLTI